MCKYPSGANGLCTLCQQSSSSSHLLTDPFEHFCSTSEPLIGCRLLKGDWESDFSCSGPLLLILETDTTSFNSDVFCLPLGVAFRRHTVANKYCQLACETQSEGGLRTIATRCKQSKSYPVLGPLNAARISPTPQWQMAGMRSPSQDPRLTG